MTRSPRRFGLLMMATCIVALTGEHNAGGQVRGIDVGPAVFSPSVDEYIVEAGDTLWDISERVVGDAYAWPKVWSFNPQITNPHWIYPGDLIRFYAPNLDLPRMQEADLVADGRMLEPEPDVQDIEQEEVSFAPAVEEVVNKLRKPKRKRRHLRGLFVSAEQLKASARLTNATPDRILLGLGDRVFFSMQNSDAPIVSKGEQMMLFRTLNKVYHPKSEEFLGYMTERTGTAEIEGNDKDVAWGRIQRTVVEVERGQYARKIATPLAVDLTHVPATKDIDGVVVAVRDSLSTIAGYQDVIFVDKGQNDGLENGNHVLLWIRGDPKTGRVENMPFEQIGRAIVVETQENTATCLVLYAKQEIEPGVPFRTILALKR